MKVAIYAEKKHRVMPVTVYVTDGFHWNFLPIEGRPNKLSQSLIIGVTPSGEIVKREAIELCSRTSLRISARFIRYEVFCGRRQSQC